MQSIPNDPEPADSSIIRTGSDGRLRYTAGQRQALLDAFDRSGISAMGFTRQHGVSYQTFITWMEWDHSIKTGVDFRLPNDASKRYKWVEKWADRWHLRCRWLSETTVTSVKMCKLASLLLPFVLSAMVVAKPTEVRDWRSNAGTTVRASAQKVENGVVSLRSEDGQVLTVRIDKFTEADQGALKDHFGSMDVGSTASSGSGLERLTEGLEFPIGETSGPVDAGGGSHYFVYLPKSLREGRKAPLLLYTHSGGGKKKTIEEYIQAAEINGWILAASVESRNGVDSEICHGHVKRCVKHLVGCLPIDEDRVYFGGNSGGAAMSFYNALRIKSLGNLALVGYSPDRKFPSGQFCYGIGGTNDYNRYSTAYAVSEYRTRGFHRFTVGGHTHGPEWIGNEGLIWLNGKYLDEHRRDSALDAERLDYEAGVIDWINALREETPYRAHYLCSFLQDEYQISGKNAVTVSQLLSELNKDPLNTKYTAGLAALDEFSEKYFAEVGESGGSKSLHTSPKIEKAAAKLAEEYAGVPEIEEIARKLGEPTVKVK